MMNLELLFFATKVTGDSSFYHTAITHANNTLTNQFRKKITSLLTMLFATIPFQEKWKAAKRHRDMPIIQPGPEVRPGQYLWIYHDLPRKRRIPLT